MAGFTEQLARLRESIAQAGRGIEDVVTAKRVYLCLDDDPGPAAQMMQRWFSETWGDSGLASAAGVFGSPAQCAAELLALRNAGADLLILDPIANITTQTERIVGELLPLLAV